MIKNGYKFKEKTAQKKSKKWTHKKTRDKNGQKQFENEWEIKQKSINYQLIYIEFLNYFSLNLFNTQKIINSISFIGK